jgi:hypothetical protein
MWPFTCNHPAHSLHIEKPQTSERIDADIDHITAHLHCRNCGKKIDIKAATFRDGWENYMNKERRKIGLPEVDYAKERGVDGLLPDDVKSHFGKSYR